jgi:hypothetical protein
MNNNPYAVDAAIQSTAAGAGNEDEAIRRRFISHEVSVKSIGILYLLGGFIGSFVSLFALVTTVFELAGSVNVAGNSESVVILFYLGLLALSGVQLWAGFGLRKLSRRARIAGIILSVIGLLGIPIGTILSTYFLYLLVSKKGGYIFSDEYKRVIAATPHVHYKTSIVVWVLLGIVVFLILTALIMPIFFSRM